MLGHLSNPAFIRDVVVQMIVLILSISVHEFGHALVADRLGDRLPRSQGRVTLNPIAHMDPIGTFALPILAMLFSGNPGYAIGWGRPVQIMPVNFTRKLRMKIAHLLVAAAGPAMNILFGIVISLVLLGLLRSGRVDNPLVLDALYRAVALNFLLAFFNLLPVPPLDGSAVLAGIMPDRSAVMDFLHRYGFYLLVIVFVVPSVSLVFSVPARALTNFWMTLIGIR